MAADGKEPEDAHHMSDLTIVCFSKDRPLQLRAYLDSITSSGLCLKRDETGQYPTIIYVIYAASNQNYSVAYEQLFKNYIHVVPVLERDLKDDLSSVLKKSTSDYVMFGCDDVLFTGSVDKRWRMVMLNELVFAFSFRLGRNITYCHPADRREVYEGVTYPNNDDILLWQWPSARGVDFSYPFELNATVYRRSDVLKYFDMIQGIAKWHPNIIEGCFHRPEILREFCQRPWMSSYETSKAYTITVNRVQDVVLNRIYEEHSAKELLEIYNSGGRIDLDYYRGKIFSSIHIGDFKIKS
jgi:hypothetical protein